MKKIIFIISLILAMAGNAEARKCLEGAVFDADENGQARLVDCAKWEREPEAVLAEQAAINAYSNENIEVSSVEYTEPDNTPLLGKAQNKIDDIWHSIYSAIFD